MGRRMLAATLGFWSVLGLAVAQEAATPAPSEFRIDRAHSSIRWKVDQVPLREFTGRFTDFDATLLIDPDHPETAQLEVRIDPGSIRTDFMFADRFDDELSNDELFFNASEFPVITFGGSDRATANAGHFQTGLP